MTDKNRDPNQPDDNNDPLGNLFGMFFGPGGQFGGSFGGGSGSSGGAQGLPFDPAMLGGIMQQLQGMLTGGSQTGALRAAEHRIPSPDPAVTDDVSRASADAFRLAELWLENVTDPAVGIGEAQALTRRQWVEQTYPGWRRLLSPIQSNMSNALSSSIAEQAPEELKPMLSGAGQMFTAMSDSMFSMQLGEALGTLSGTVLTGTEFGLPLLEDFRPTLVEANISGAAAEFGVEPTELRIYLAVRELALLWLFKRAPWLVGHLETALSKYAAGIELDLERIQGLAGSIDPSNLEQLSEDIRQGMFNPQPTEAQRQALESVQNLLSVIAGWADVISYQACAPLDGRDTIREALRSRQVTEGAADRTFSELVGLQLTPARMRDAASLFSFLEQSEGPEARDAVFTHPDLLPTTQDLDDPLGYRERRRQEWSADSSMDAALARLLAESAEQDDAAGDPDAAVDETGEPGETGGDSDSDNDDDAGSGSGTDPSA
ncbi:zinc-dependent metalloprotease [Brevibacterium daeguense]|uniref:Zinc-dependent metalloprotease n=1 Tax=Brevibacterium daeguense TaxID=909936 RepID=A0ABP8EJD5_9MICO|nr:zinc-dependent metalloprotease [Brevibacterium daeguense]